MKILTSALRSRETKSLEPLQHVLYENYIFQDFFQCQIKKVTFSNYLAAHTYNRFSLHDSRILEHFEFFFQVHQIVA